VILKSMNFIQWKRCKWEEKVEDDKLKEVEDI
jgi:hypothetical protein